jgi:SAM-dependent methyltransferase
MISKVNPVVFDDHDHSNWFETWFDSPYYHLLYKNRDRCEAELFLDALIKYLNPEPVSRILDVACGKGRHSIYLNKKGFDVTGFDLSSESIQFDSQFENDTLHFYLHDMREIFRSNYFDIVLNLFSSFGYFDKEHDNMRCLNAHSTALKKNGIFVFDYFNSEKVIAKGNSQSEEEIEGVNFNIEKYMEGGLIKKKIIFSDKGVDYKFEEQLPLIDRKGFEKYFKKAGLSVIECFGSYKLDPFDVTVSDRLILIAKK